MYVYNKDKENKKDRKGNKLIYYLSSYSNK